MGRGIWRRLWRTDPPRQQPDAECPICGAPVITESTTWMGGSMSGPMFSARTREELVAACPTHGRSPFNANTLEWMMEEGRTSS